MSAHTFASRPAQNTRCHVWIEADRRPLCGGGHGAKSSSFIADFGPCNCRACLKLMARGG